jgi:hypothetical protein
LLKRSSTSLAYPLIEQSKSHPLWDGCGLGACAGGAGREQQREGTRDRCQSGESPDQRKSGNQVQLREGAGARCKGGESPDQRNSGNQVHFCTWFRAMLLKSGNQVHFCTWFRAMLLKSGNNLQFLQLVLALCLFPPGIL